LESSVQTMLLRDRHARVQKLWPAILVFNLAFAVPMCVLVQDCAPFIWVCAGDGKTIQARNSKS